MNGLQQKMFALENSIKSKNGGSFATLSTQASSTNVSPVVPGELLVGLQPLQPIPFG